MATSEPVQPLLVNSDDVRGALLDRRNRVEALAGHGPASVQARELLGEIDRAIERLAAGTYGRCEACGDPIEPERLAADPLARFCVGDLSPRQARDLERDLELAARVQHELLPPRHHAALGWSFSYRYLPLGAVSGDYLDIVSSPDGGRELTVLLGDIAGKGVAASMLMAHLHASVRTLIAMSLPLSQVVGRANRIFCESTMASHYATLVCARLSADGDVEICNAGHCPPLLVRNGEVQEIESTGVPVGLFCVDDYGTRRLRLESGDTLLMYTDGVTEARNEDDCEYGAEALSRIASLHGTLLPEALVERCVTEVTTFRAGVQAVDDLTVLAIRRS